MSFTIDEVDVDQRNSDGETALHLAARNGKIDALNILLKKAKVDVTNNLQVRLYKFYPQIVVNV